jgi:hypothetical protein
MRIALITEGISEYRVLKHILGKFFKEHEPEINQIQPRLVREKQVGIGGWVEVLKYCSRSEIGDILIENDLLVIQIDTDNSCHAPFDVAHTCGSERKSESALCKEVEEKLASLIQPDILASYQGRIIFAVCVNTIECWLITAFHQKGMSNCLESLNSILCKEKMPRIEVEKNSPKSRLAYEAVLRKWSKRQELLRSATLRPSFMRFLETLTHFDHGLSA